MVACFKFCLLCVSFQIQANFVQAGDTEFVTEVPDGGSINHIVVFLTGIMPFPDGTGGSGEFRALFFILPLSAHDFLRFFTFHF